MSDDSRLALIRQMGSRGGEAERVRPGDLRVGDGSNWFMAVLRQLRVRARLAGCLAAVEVESVFQSLGEGGPRPALYAYPLPEGAVVVEFQLETGTQSLRAEVRELQAVADLDLPEPDILPPEFETDSIAVFPAGMILPGSEVRTRLVYSQLLTACSGTIELCLPLQGWTAGPSNPLAYLVKVLAETGGAGEPVVVRTVLDVEIEVEGPEIDQASSSCNYPMLAESEPGGGIRIRLDPAAEPPADDLLLRLRTAGDEAATHLAVQAAPPRTGEKANFALSVIPPPQLVGETFPKDVMVIVDPLIDVAIASSIGVRVLGELLQSLGPDDRFNLLVAGDRVARFHVEPLVPATEGNVAGAMTVLSRVSRLSNPVVLGAVRRAARILADVGEKGRGRAIVLLSQSPPGDDSSDLGSSGAAMAGVRMAVVKLHPGAVSPVLAQLVRITRGRLINISSEADLTDGLDRLVEGIQPPLLSELSFNDHGLEVDPSSLVPSRLKDVHAAAPVVLLGQHQGPSGSLVLRGLRARGATFARPVQACKSACRAVRDLWVNARLERIQRATGGTPIERQAFGEPEEVARRLSRREGVACALTAWVVFESQSVQAETPGQGSVGLGVGMASVPGAVRPRRRPGAPAAEPAGQPGRGMSAAVEELLESSADIDSLMETVVAPARPAAAPAGRARMPDQVKDLLRVIDEARHDLGGSNWLKFRWKKWSPDELREKLIRLRGGMTGASQFLDKLYAYGVPEYNKWGIQVARKDLDNLLIGLDTAGAGELQGIDRFLAELRRAILVRYGQEKPPAIKASDFES